MKIQNFNIFNINRHKVSLAESHKIMDKMLLKIRLNILVISLLFLYSLTFFCLNLIFSFLSLSVSASYYTYTSVFPKYFTGLTQASTIFSEFDSIDIDTYGNFFLTGITNDSALTGEGTNQYVMAAYYSGASVTLTWAKYISLCVFSCE